MELSDLVGKAHIFICTFDGREFKLGGYRGGFEVINLSNVRTEQGEVVADKLWCNYSSCLQDASLVKGDVIRLRAKVLTYRKYKCSSMDDTGYKLGYAAEVLKV